jgi:CheY-like chemotaxis protein
VTRLALKSSKPIVLVVDDNTDAIEALAQILEYEGYAVATAYDGRRRSNISAVIRRPT